MSECDRISELYLVMNDDEADKKTNEYFQEHLTHCNHCSEDFRWYGTTVQALAGLERISPPPDFQVQLRQRIEALHSQSFFEQLKDFFATAPRMPLPVGAVALAFVVVVGFAMYNDAFDTFKPGVNTSRTLQGEALGPIKTAKSVPVAKQPPNMESKGLNTLSNSLNHSKIAAIEPSTDLHSFPLTRTENTASGAYASMVTFPTIADKLGADNLTVESLTIPQALESLKKILPNINGRIVMENHANGKNGTIVRVLIPPKAYPDLTTTLIEHGALESGAGRGVTPPKIVKDQNVLLHIRFVPPSMTKH